MQVVAHTQGSPIRQGAIHPALGKKSGFSTGLLKIINFMIRVWHLITCNYFKTDKVSQAVLQNSQIAELSTRASKESIRSVLGFSTAMGVGALLEPVPLQPFPLSPAAGAGAGAGVSVDSFASTFERFEDTRSPRLMDWVYVLTNECGLDKTQLFLGQRPLVANGCHIGFSGLHNFDIIAKRRSEYALLFDINHDNTLLLRNVLKIIKISLNRMDFIRNLQALLRRLEAVKDIRLKGIAYSEALMYEIGREGSWLNTDEGFDHIRRIVLSGHICPITQNITNCQVFVEIARLLKERSIQVDTLYLSNICNYMKKTQKEFCTTVRCFLKDNTIIIHCVARIGDFDAPELAFIEKNTIQSVILAKDLNEDLQLIQISPQPDDMTLQSDYSKRKHFEYQMQTTAARAEIQRQKDDDETRRQNLLRAGIKGLFD
jgi:hypothetical protein